MSVPSQQIEQFNAQKDRGTESTDPDYLAWRDEKVAEALKEAKAHPEQRVPQSEVWKKFGLES